MASAGTIYFDYAATTPVDERVMNVMTPYFTEQFGNPSSIHYFGQKAESAVENARYTIAACLKCQPEEVIFTSGGTESDNLALRGMAFAKRNKHKANRILITPVEHHAVLHTARQLATQHGFTLEYLPVDDCGRVDPFDVETALHQDTAIVSVIYANNEIGTINPIAEIGKICREHGVPLHTDAVQAAAHLPIDMTASKIDLLTIGAHKFYGPKGIGALAVRKGQPLIPTQTGGSQEFGLRSGTHNVPYIVGMAEALQLATQSATTRKDRLIPLRDQLIQSVLSSIPRSRITGHLKQRLPNHASFVFEGVNGNTLLMMLDQAGFACSSGSACKSGSPEPSDVLTAIGLSRNWALGSLRVTLGRDTTQEHVESFIRILPEIIAKVRKN